MPSDCRKSYEIRYKTATSEINIYAIITKTLHSELYGAEFVDNSTNSIEKYLKNLHLYEHSKNNLLVFVREKAIINMI